MGSKSKEGVHQIWWASFFMVKYSIIINVKYVLKPRKYLVVSEKSSIFAVEIINKEVSLKNI